MFEHHQELLEKNTEKLHEYTEQSLDVIDRTQVSTGCVCCECVCVLCQLCAVSAVCAASAVCAVCEVAAVCAVSAVLAIFEAALEATLEQSIGIMKDIQSVL